MDEESYQESIQQEKNSSIFTRNRPANIQEMADSFKEGGMHPSKAAQIILNDSKSERVDKNITPVKEIFQFVGHDKITEQDRENSVQLRTPIIIPSAGKDPIFTKTPKSLISINKKPIMPVSEIIAASVITCNVFSP